MMKGNKKSIGYLGPAGTFTELAVNALFPNRQSVSLQGYSSIQACLLAARQIETNYTVVPIENSIGGSVDMTLDWLINEINVPIQAEVRLPVHHELLANQSQSSTHNYEVIYGHPQALKQCNQYLRDFYPDIEQRATDSSALAAKIISENPDESWLAIANFVAKDIYGLLEIKKNIENNIMNMTRFIVLGYEELMLPEDSMKSSIIVSFPEKKLMMLHKVLAIIDHWGITPTKIESVPMKTELGEYVFLIDIDTTNVLSSYVRACSDIRDLNCKLRQLGTYRVLTADIGY